MKTAFGRTSIFLTVLALSACTDNTGDESDGHLLETQQQALERARDVEQDVAEAARRRAEQSRDAEEGG